MAQRKETKKKIKVRDLKPKKDAKGGVVVFGPGQSHSSKVTKYSAPAAAAVKVRT